MALRSAIARLRYVERNRLELAPIPFPASRPSFPEPVLCRVFPRQLSFRTACGLLAQVLRLKMT
jgi:hypothetical protein